MIKFILVIQIFIVLIFITSIARSFTPSSSYLIANIAISLNDYDTAAAYYSKDQFINYNIINDRNFLHANTE